MISHPALLVVKPVGNLTLISILFEAYNVEAVNSKSQELP